MRSTTHAIAAAAMFGLAVSQPASALQTTKPATSPATAPASTMPAGATQMEATITSVKGIVQVRTSEGAAWQAAKPGMKLDQGAEIRTGLRSAIQFTVGPDEVITLDRLGTVTVLQAFQDQGRAKTDIGMKYGRTRYDIRDTNLQHESTIRSPGSTLALRGTDIVYEDQAPWVPQATSVNGRAEFRNYKRQFVAFGGKKRASIAADKSSPAQQALTNTKNDQRGAFAGRTAAEDELNLTLMSIGGTDARGLTALRELETGFGFAFAGTSNVPGPLEFQLAWQPLTGTLGPAANVDFLVTDPRGQTASFSNPTIGSTSAFGQHGGDDAGANGNGAESVIWGLFFPPGTYTVTAQHQGGADAQVFISALQGNAGEKIASFGSDPDPPIVLSAGQSVTETVTAKRARVQRSRGAEQRSAARELRSSRNR